MSLDMLATDPLAGVKLTPLRSKGHHPWELEECARFEAHHALGTRERLAYELLLQVGHSRCDIVRMGRQHVRNGVLSLQRQKTKVAFDVPVMPMLQAAIAAMPPSDHMMFLVTAYGKPFTAAGFGNWFRDICNAAGLPKRCTSHGLRKAAATRAADRGATTTQLMAWFGSRLPDAGVYRRDRAGARDGSASRRRGSAAGPATWRDRRASVILKAALNRAWREGRVSTDTAWRDWEQDQHGGGIKKNSFTLAESDCYRERYEELQGGISRKKILRRARERPEIKRIMKERGEPYEELIRIFALKPTDEIPT